jgi:hypothetical protein
MFHYIEDPRFQYHILDDEHAAQAIEVMTQSFCNYEPMTKFINVTYDEFKPFAEIVVAKAIEDKMSVVALDKGRVVACTVVEDLVDPAPLDLNKLTPKFKYIFSLLEQISGPYFKDKKINKNQIAHLFITAVHPDYFHQGLSRQVNFQSIFAAKKRKYNLMVSELTHWFNEKGLVKYLPHAKQILGTMVYNDYELEGHRPFKGLEGCANSWFWALRDDVDLI